MAVVSQWMGHSDVNLTVAATPDAPAMVEEEWLSPYDGF